MPASPDDLFAYLDRLGIAHQTVTHAPVFTVEESRALARRVPGVHSKNLFLRDKKGALFLVVASENAAIELKSLHRLLGASGRFSFGSVNADTKCDWSGSATTATPVPSARQARAVGAATR